MGKTCSLLNIPSGYRLLSPVIRNHRGVQTNSQDLQVIWRLGMDGMDGMDIELHIFIKLLSLSSAPNRQVAWRWRRAFLTLHCLDCTRCDLKPLQIALIRNAKFELYDAVNVNDACISLQSILPNWTGSLSAFWLLSASLPVLRLIISSVRPLRCGFKEF